MISEDLAPVVEHAFSRELASAAEQAISERSDCMLLLASLSKFLNISESSFINKKKLKVAIICHKIISRLSTAENSYCQPINLAAEHSDGILLGQRLLILAVYDIFYYYFVNK